MISLIAFANVPGFAEVHQTQGTFTRPNFLETIKLLIDSDIVKAYPSKNGVLVMDDAAIHRRENFAFHSIIRSQTDIFAPMLPDFTAQ